MKAYVSPLRYPGGKRKLYHYVDRLLIHNNLRGCTYVEPFAGGAGLALKLYQYKRVKKLILNDIDTSIYSFWYAVLNHSRELIHIIMETPITIDEWYKQKYIQNNKEKVDLLSLAFSTFFLNRTNRSGILKGSFMGGEKQSGANKIDCRYNKIDLINRIRYIADHKCNIDLYNLDAKDFIIMYANEIQNQSVFFFIDPPYYSKGRKLYVNYYTHYNHEQLANTIKKYLSSSWVVTYDNVIEIKELFSEFYQKDYHLFYTAQNKKIGKEIMIYSDRIKPVSFH